MTHELTSEDYVRAAIEAGFKTNELSPSMRDFANRIVYDARQKLRAELQADGWRQCAKGQHTTQFCGQLEEAVKAERETWPNLQPVIAWLKNGCNPKDAAKELRSYDEVILARGAT